MSQPTHGLTFSRMSGGDEDSSFDPVFDIYSHALPASERKSRAQLQEMLGRSGYLFLAARLDGRVAGFSVLYIPRSRACALLEYMAVDERLRGRGIGAALFRETVDVARKRGPVPVVLEVEAVGNDDDGRVLRLARQRFYRRLGCIAVAGLDYVLPLATAGHPPHMELFVFSENSDRLERETLRRWLTTIYVEVYGCSADDSRLDRMVNALPEIVFLR